MKFNINDLNKAFENRIRLGIMSALIANDGQDFTSLKTVLEVTDGNLASHLKALEKLTYISVSKQFIGRKPNTKYFCTTLGKTEFSKHLDALENLLNNRN